MSAYAHPGNESSINFFRLRDMASRAFEKIQGFRDVYDAALNITATFFQCRLRRGKPGDRYAEGRTGNIIQSRLMTETDGIGIAAMFAANAKLEFCACLASPFRRDLHK